MLSYDEQIVSEMSQACIGNKKIYLCNPQPQQFALMYVFQI